MLKKIFGALILCLTSLTAAAAPTELELCETYQTVAHSLQCSDNNYLLQFGYRYCRAYVQTAYRYLPETQITLSKIRKCLIADITSDTSLTCDNSETRAMESHLRCYVQSGFCEIDAFDQILIYQVAARETHRTSFQKTMSTVGFACLQRKFSLDLRAPEPSFFTEP